MALLSDNFDENYELFLGESLETGCVWGLEGPEGWALCESNINPELSVMPLWSQPEYAAKHCVGDWSAYKPIAISLEEFLDEWLPGMHEDVLFVGINWNDDLEGDEMEPIDLLEDYEG